MGSSRLLGTAGPASCPSTALLRDRVYIVKPMLPWAGWALTPPFHHHRPKSAEYLCCTCPEVTLGGRYPLSLPCGARTFLIRCLSACVRGCPTWSRKYCTPTWANCQISLQNLLGGDILIQGQFLVGRGHIVLWYDCRRQSWIFRFAARRTAPPMHPRDCMILIVPKTNVLHRFCTDCL